MTGRPQIFILAGPNGAGKTTFALEFLPNEASCPHFVNADLIAAGLNPFDPSRVAVAAGRILLQRLAAHASRGESFAFETTLSGRGYAAHVPRWQDRGFEVNLLFLGLSSPDIAIARVRQRVREGGHDIPEPVIRRRFDAGRLNFDRIYRALVDRWFLYDNGGAKPVLLDAGVRGAGVKEKTTDPATIVMNDPILRGADAALRRAAVKAQERARAFEAADAAPDRSTPTKVPDKPA